jgi:L-rhamnose mutarotase
MNLGVNFEYPATGLLRLTHLEGLNLSEYSVFQEDLTGKLFGKIESNKSSRLTKSSLK